MRDRVATLAAAALLGLSLSLGAQAQSLTVSQYQHPKTAQELAYNKAYMMGITDGLIAYNAIAENKQFCIPGLLPHLSFDQANDIMLRWSRSAGGGADLPLGRALYYGLAKAYPCTN